MINNLTFSITDRCNGRCKMCQIWKNGNLDGMSVSEVSELLSQECFNGVETVSISGGEPFLRKDIIEVIEAIYNSLPKLNRIFLNTNGTIINKVVDVCKYCCELVPNVILSISLEGNKDTNKKIRGIDTYDNVINLINLVKNETPNVFVCLSMTLTNDNCNLENLNHVRRLSE
jgi:molybdenum cofactor biosynthesis enzyme MoaA